MSTLTLLSEAFKTEERPEEDRGEQKSDSLADRPLDATSVSTCDWAPYPSTVSSSAIICDAASTLSVSATTQV